MKIKLLKLSLSVAIFLLFVTSVVGQGVPPHQNPKYGADSASRISCAMNISLYSEFYKQKNYKDALVPWRKVFKECPKATKNIYIQGATIVSNLIVREKDKIKKEAYIDTLMMIYDQRIEYFGSKGFVLSFKGVVLNSYRGEAANKEVFEILGEAMSLEGDNTKAAVVSIYMQVAVALYKAEEIDGVKVIEAYTFSMETLDKSTTYNKMLIEKGPKYEKKAKKELENIKTSVDNVEALFSESGAATCEALVSIFTPKYEENIKNLDWLKKVNKLLNRADCTEEELFAKTAEQQYKLEPSAEAAHNLARLFLKKEVFEKADKYYDEAAKLQEVDEKKALYYYEWSQLAFAMETYPKVRTLSNKAIENNPADGRPYLMIGKAYAASKKLNIGSETCEFSAVYWVAVDSFAKAKKVDASLAEEASGLIETYSKYYPKSEEWFMAVGTSEGDPYTVGGWINVTTKVRF
ncbi:MAG: hypothetical protein PF517_18835 [Salinivirgaceae bacterium]|jgi:tetratricopeptide (TPR) repeat protein|nr:hypothetical protein [Salinivirgaceae bacterium]